MNSYIGYIIKEITSLDDQVKMFNVDINYLHDYFKHGKVKSNNIEELRNELSTNFESIKDEFETLNSRLNWIIFQISNEERNSLLK